MIRNVILATPNFRSLRLPYLPSPTLKEESFAITEDAENSNDSFLFLHWILLFHFLFASTSHLSVCFVSSASPTSSTSTLAPASSPSVIAGFIFLVFTEFPYDALVVLPSTRVFILKTLRFKRTKKISKRDSRKLSFAGHHMCAGAWKRRPVTTSHCLNGASIRDADCGLERCGHHNYRRS